MAEVDIYEEMIGMPLLLKLPRGLGAGTRSPLSIDMVDLRSTLTGLARIDAPSDHGIDYSDEIESLMADPPAPIHAYSERPPYLYALRVGDWKIIRRDRRDSTSWQLYNLRRDPQELMDLAESEPETLARLMTELEGAMRSAGNLSWDAADSLPELDPEAERDLRALGYIQ
jgi:arylsulfatase A-like enzyme